MRLTHRIRGIFTFAFALALGFSTSLSAAGGPEDFTIDHAKVKEVIAVQDQFTKGLMEQPEILGTAVGQDDDGEMVLVIYVNSEAKNHGEVMRALPPTLKGKRVRPDLTDPFRAFGKRQPPTASVPHTGIQSPPILLGTSGGWTYDLANGYCCGGTLGSLVQVNGVQYILSNYHVFESDIEPGRNQRIGYDSEGKLILLPEARIAKTGDPIIQPGLIDAGCNMANAQTVATLFKLSALPNNNVDCSIAQVIFGKVKDDGSILEIGPISSGIVAAKLRQAVKKSGRTTGLTRSSVSGLNATITVTYQDECVGQTAFTKTFTGQIVIRNVGSSFLAGGDSGSLMVQDVNSRPRAVGLLYAGSSTIAIANPIGEVLAFLESKLGGTATMVGAP